MSYGGFSFIFFRDSVTENVTENVTERKIPSDQIVLNLLKENPMRSREEMAGLMGKTVRTVQRALDKLSDEGRIRRIGTARAGYWEVVQDRQKATEGIHAGMEDE
jgi:ATP-dependent DNA helicase RecG